MPIGRHTSALASALVLAAALAGGACTQAELAGGGAGSGPDGGDGADGGGNGNGNGGGRRDGGGGEPEVDGAPAHQPGPVSLTQSNSLDVLGSNSVACFEAVNSYYRVFNLEQAGITGELEVSRVTFGVEECVSGTGGIGATVVLHTLQGRFVLANLTQVARAETVIPDVAEPGAGQVGGILHGVPIAATVPGGSKLVVEVTHPGLGADQTLLMGSNRDGQTGPTYLRAPDCNTDEPTDSDLLEDADGDRVTMHWVLVVDGEELP
jgi:hypothetical protein